jgi:hypothetical protein
MGKLNLTYHDFGTPQEAGKLALPCLDITAANHDAQDALKDALIVAINGITLGVHTASSWVAEEAANAVIQPASQFAQREIKWLVKYHDNSTGEKYSVEIPTADLDLLLAGSDERLDLAGTEGAAFKVAFEAFVRTETHGVTVDDVIYVSRNL